MFDATFLESFSRRYVTKYYVQCDGMSSKDMLGELENIATYGTGFIPYDWLVRDDPGIEEGSPVSAKEVLLVIDEHAEMLVRYIRDLFSHVKDIPEND